VPIARFSDLDWRRAFAEVALIEAQLALDTWQPHGKP